MAARSSGFMHPRQILVAGQPRPLGAAPLLLRCCTLDLASKKLERRARTRTTPRPKGKACFRNVNSRGFYCLPADTMNDEEAHTIPTFFAPHPVPQSSLDHFSAIPWTAAYLRDPAYTAIPTFSRTLKRTGEDAFFSLTI